MAAEKVDSLEGHERAAAVCGFAESYKQAPFDTKLANGQLVSIIGLNELYKYLPARADGSPGWDEWWEIHDGETLGVTKRDLGEGEQKRHIEWLKQDHGDRPIFMQPQFCDGRFPNARPAPIEQLCDTFGRYFTSTIAYMLAKAIMDNNTWIGLYGIDLVSEGHGNIPGSNEYRDQRPNTEYLCGVARGQNRTLEIPESSALLKAGYLYGIEQPYREKGGVYDAVTNHRAGLIKKRDESLATLQTLDGAIQESDNTLLLLDYKDKGSTVKTY